MSRMTIVYLPDRAVIAIGGRERISFLHNLLPCAVAPLAGAGGRGVWGALLSPQGKIRFDFLLYGRDQEVWLECAAAQMMEIGPRLERVSTQC